MASKHKTYNLPGSGTLNCNVLPYAWRLYDFFEFYGHELRIKNIYQLGHLIDVFPGAHHTRYEYLFLQWTIISELCKLTDSNFGLGTQREWYGKIEKADKYPTSGEILQVLTLLLNIGHLGGTFSSERAFLQFLKSNKKVRRTFKRGLKSREKDFFEKVLADNRFYSIHQLIAFFFINRCKRKSSINVEFCNRLLGGYCYNDGEEDFTKFKNWKLYKSIRRISYLILDSHYSPVPFSLDLSSILLNFDELYREIIAEDSSYNVALDELEKVLEKTVYLNANAALTTSTYSHSYLDFLKNDGRNELDRGSITSLNNLLKNKFIKHGTNELNLKKDWKDKTVLQLEFDNSNYLKIESFSNPFQQEKYLINKIGKSYSNVSFLPNPNNNYFKLVFSIKDRFREKRKIKTGLNISNSSLRFIDGMPENYINKYRADNFRKIAIYLLKLTFGWDKRYLLENWQVPTNKIPYIYVRGVKRFTSHIETYISEINDHISKDELNELVGIKNAVNSINHQGYYFAFLGSAKVFGKDQSPPTAEFDGLIFCPQNTSDNIGFIVESKNTQTPQTDAQRQLEQRLDQELSANLKYKMLEIENGAYANIGIS